MRAWPERDRPKQPVSLENPKTTSTKETLLDVEPRALQSAIKIRQISTRYWSVSERCRTVRVARPWDPCVSHMHNRNRLQNCNLRVMLASFLRL
jgi:hypothetical protein